jgi:hypothetical protein
MFHHHLNHPHHCRSGCHPQEHHGTGPCVTRRFRSQAEKLEMLKHYKGELEKELAGVEEAIAKHED